MLVRNVEQALPKWKEVFPPLAGAEQKASLTGEVVTEGEKVVVPFSTARQTAVKLLQKLAHVGHDGVNQVRPRRQVHQPRLHSKHVHEAAEHRTPSARYSRVPAAR